MRGCAYKSNVDLLYNKSNKKSIARNILTSANLRLCGIVLVFTGCIARPWWKGYPLLYD